MHLNEPRNYFPYVLASHWAYPWPRHRADEVGAAWRRPESLVGNGPFVLSEVGQTGARLSANPHWRTASGNVGEVRIDVPRPHGRAVARRVGGRALRPAARAGRADGGHGHDRRSARPRSRRRSSASTWARSRWPTSACAGRSRTPSTAPRWWRSRPGVDLAAAGGGAIPPVMPGHSDNARPPVRPRAWRARCWPRPASPAAKACPSSSWTRGRGHPPQRSPSSSPRSACAPASSRTASTSASRRRRTPGSRAGTPTTPTPTASTSGCWSWACRSIATTRRTRCSLARASRATATSACACTASSSARGSASAQRSCRSPTRASSCCAAPTCRA